MTFFWRFCSIFCHNNCHNCTKLWCHAKKLRHEPIGCLDRSYTLWIKQNRAQPVKIATFWPFFGDVGSHVVTITVTTAPSCHMTWQNLSNESIDYSFRYYTLLFIQNEAQWAKIGVFRPFWGPFLDPLSKFCHNNCHNGTGISFNTTKVKSLVHMMLFQVLHALNQPKQSSVGRDMCFSSECLTHDMLVHLDHVYLT